MQQPRPQKTGTLLFPQTKARKKGRERLARVCRQKNFYFPSSDNNNIKERTETSKREWSEQKENDQQMNEGREERPGLDSSEEKEKD
jgi:hypothetical protein